MTEGVASAIARSRERSKRLTHLLEHNGSRAMTRQIILMLLDFEKAYRMYLGSPD